MKKLLILLIPATLLAQTDEIKYDTFTHQVKTPLTTTFTVCDFDFTGINVCGLAGTGTVTSITATAPIIVTPSPITSTGVISIDPDALVKPHAVTLFVDGSGTVLTTGTKNPIKIPYGGTLQGWLLIATPSGSVTVDIFRAADGAGLPVTSIIGAGTKPALSSAVENSSTSFTSWTSTTLTAKDNLAISLSGISTVTYCSLTLYYQ